MSPRDIILALNGEWAGNRGLARCPVPGHGRNRGDINPSLSITSGDRQRLLIHCFAGCEYDAVLDAIGRKLGSVDAAVPSPCATASGEWEAAWREGSALASSPAAAYLSRFRRVLSPLQPSVEAWPLRFHPHAPFSTSKTWRTPGLLAAITSTSRLIGMQVTALRRDGLGKATWRKTRHTFGRIRGGAVRLGNPLPGRGERALAVAEGVETALGFNRLSGYSCWAALGGSLANFDPPADLDELVIAADHDQSGLKLAHRLALRLRTARPALFVEIRHPAVEGRDWADEAFAAFGDG